MTINTTRYRDTKWYQSIPSFGIVGIDQIFGSHFNLDQNLLHTISINMTVHGSHFVCTCMWAYEATKDAV